MRIWISRNSEVPPREQLSTQILLGILSKDLHPGEKLPSTRELARRLRLHPNTVSAAYRDLRKRGWVMFRKGSGVYVPASYTRAPVESSLELDQLISAFLEVAREKGFSLREIESKLIQWLQLQPPDHFLLIEPDEELRKVLAAEIQEATAFPVRVAGLSDCADASVFAGAAPVYLFNKSDQIQKLLPPRSSPMILQSRSVPDTLAANIPIRPTALIAVASRWPEFLKWGRAVLVAAGVSPDALIFCDARVSGWQRRLVPGVAVIADTLTARSVPDARRMYVFRLIADSSIAELREFLASLPDQEGRTRDRKRS